MGSVGLVAELDKRLTNQSLRRPGSVLRPMLEDGRRPFNAKPGRECVVDDSSGDSSAKTQDCSGRFVETARPWPDVGLHFLCRVDRPKQRGGSADELERLGEVRSDLADVNPRRTGKAAGRLGHGG